MKMISNQGLTTIYGGFNFWKFMAKFVNNYVNNIRPSIFRFFFSN